MAKNPPRRKKSQAFPSQTTEPSTKLGAKPSSKPPRRWDLIAIFLIISIGGTYLALAMRPSKIPRFVYDKDTVRTYPHDEKAFTQGLVYSDGKLWESTGRYNESTIREVDLETGEVIKKTELPREFFGEGVVRWKDTLIQLTWKEEKIFVYDLDLKKIAEHDFDGDAWGITTDGNSLIISDGTSKLRFFDPETFTETHSIIVRDDQSRIGSLNELEFVNGKVFANRWRFDFVYEINPENGHVESIIDLTGLWPSRDRPSDGVMNGIAFNTKSKRLLVTGKLCPFIYEIDLIPAN